MSETALELLEKVMALEPEERRAIVDELYLRVHDEEGDAEYEQEGLNLAEERLAELERDGARLIPFEEAMKSLRR